MKLLSREFDNENILKRRVQEVEQINMNHEKEVFRPTKNPDLMDDKES